MSGASSQLVLSAGDRARVAEVDRLSLQGAGGVDALVSMLTERSWAVRRAVVAALARLGNEAVAALSSVLVERRDDEARLAAAVDALSASRGDAVDAMLMLIAREQTAPVLCDAAQVLGRRQSIVSIPALERLTAHPDDNVAVAAIEALGRIGNGAGLDALLRVIESRNFFRIFPAIDVLGRSGDARVLQPLGALLDNPRYALEAARALGRTCAAEAAGSLAKLLRKANDSLTRVVAVSLCSLRAGALQRYGTADAVEASVRAAEEPQPILERLAQSVPGATPEEQLALCTVLSWVPDGAAAPTLLALLDVMPAAAAPAVRALGGESDAQLAEALRDGDSARRVLLLPILAARTRSAEGVLPCLDDRDATVRALACNALARIGDVAAVPRLFELLREPDALVSQAAVGAIQSLGSASTERLALAAAAAPEAHVRRSALRIVAYFGFAKGKDLLVEAVRGEDDRLRDVAIQGLALLDDPAALEVILSTAAHKNPRARAAAMRALGQTGARPNLLAALRAGLGDADAWVRYYACQSLGKLGDTAAIGQILRLVDDPAGQVRVAAVDALAHLDAPAALQSLRAAAASPDPDVQRAAILGLGSRKLPEALPALLEAAKAADASTRLIALSSIAPYAGAEALQALAVAAQDPEANVRDAAIGFLAARSEDAATAALIPLTVQPLTRERAIDALSSPASGRIGNLSRALEKADGELAPPLVATLARMRRPDAFAAIVDALALPNVFARRAAASALAALRTPAARAALERSLDSDADAEVRRAALAGLGP